MKFLPLFFASLRRKPIRTILTTASIIVAFLLFGLLKTMQGALELGADLAGVDRLATMHKMSLIQSFPFSWMGGIYQDERNQIAAQGTDAETFLTVYPEYKLTPEQRADWLSDRRSAIVGKALADRFKWKVGDTVPIRSSFFRKAEGGDTWDMRIAALYEASNGDNQSLFFHYDYVNEALAENAGRDIAIWIIMKIQNPADAQKVSAAVDALFANSPAETKTATERAFIQGFANQMGDIATIVTAVAS